MRVLVTRPEPGASETAARLAALGHNPVVLPLTEIRPVEAANIDAANAIEAVAVTSANAVRHAPNALLAPVLGKPCFAVGDRTAEAARAAGFRGVRSAARDAEELARLLVVELRPAARIAYLCGRVRRPEFEQALAARGFEILVVETYDTVGRPVGADLDRMRVPLDAALVSSVAGARALAALVLDPTAAPLFVNTRYFCLSARVAQALPAQHAERIRVSPEPTEAALISLLGAGGAAYSFS